MGRGTYAGCPGAGQGGLDLGAEEVGEPVGGLAGVLMIAICRQAAEGSVYHGWSAISKTCIRGTRGAMLTLWLWLYWRCVGAN